MRGFKFETSETRGFDVPVTFETREQAEAISFLAMLSEENQKEVFELIMKLTMQEDTDRWASHAYAWDGKDDTLPITFFKETDDEV
ncbi:hypothetical protein OZX68_03380 [Streptococcaceae bacterium ESL0729]|nr:hypothetical protein OZX68_03380 [Streptococcaceae bacterium ESL0729]